MFSIQQDPDTKEHVLVEVPDFCYNLASTSSVVNKIIATLEHNTSTKEHFFLVECATSNSSIAKQLVTASTRKHIPSVIVNSLPKLDKLSNLLEEVPAPSFVVLNNLDSQPNSREIRNYIKRKTNFALLFSRPIPGTAYMLFDRKFLQVYLN